MTERSAEQGPVQTRPGTHDDHEDTARIPLTERLQRRLSAAGEHNGTGTGQQAPVTPDQNGSGSGSGSSAANGAGNGRVLPPPPAELVEERSRAEAARQAEEARRAEQARQDEAARQAEVRRAEQARAEQARLAREQETMNQQVAPAPVPLAPVGTAPATPASQETPRRTPITAGRTPGRSPRRARLRLSRIDPWSVMKVAFLLSIALGIVLVVSVFLIWSVLGAAGVWSSINNTVSDTVSSGNNVSSFDIQNYLGMSRVLGFTMLVSVIDVVLITAIATLGAFLYNMAASLLGGVEVTLSEDAG